MANGETPVKPAARRRVPNVERTARTRAKLIEATIASLHEIGFHQTTTTVVAQRAGVSRGAMLHHFPTKADLMMAAAERMRDMRGELHRERLANLETPADKFLSLIDVLWEAMVSPSGVARIELMLSTRSDPDMAEKFVRMNDELDKRHKESVWGLCQSAGMSGEAARDKIYAFVQLYAAALRGLAIDALREESREGADSAVELLKTFQVQMFEELVAHQN